MVDCSCTNKKKENVGATVYVRNTPVKCKVIEQERGESWWEPDAGLSVQQPTAVSMFFRRPSCLYCSLVGDTAPLYLTPRSPTFPSFFVRVMTNCRIIALYTAAAIHNGSSWLSTVVGVCVEFLARVSKGMRMASV